MGTVKILRYASLVNLDPLPSILSCKCLDEAAAKCDSHLVLDVTVTSLCNIAKACTLHLPTQQDIPQ
jgi:hypothetical protein